MKCVAVTQEGGELGGRIKLKILFKTLLLVLDENDDEPCYAQISIRWCGAGNK